MKNNTPLTIRELKIEEKTAWNSLVSNSQYSCFMQTSSWADFKELEGYQTFRYGLFKQHNLDQNADQELVGGCIFYLYPHQHQANLLMSPGGPILPEYHSETALELLLNIAEKISHEKGAIALRIEPNWPYKPAYLPLQNFVRAPVDLLPSETLIIDLCRDSEQILAAMKPKGRYNIRLSQRYGVITEFSDNPQNIPLFYDMFWQTVERQKFFGEPYSFFINLCQTLFKDHLAEIGLARYQGEILAAVLIIYCGNTATYLYGGTSLLHRQTMANYGLHWAAMQRAKNRGCQFYDFYGFTHNPHHNYAKFSQFKSKFGGEYITTIGAQDYFFYDQLADTLVNLFQSLQFI